MAYTLKLIGFKFSMLGGTVHHCLKELEVPELAWLLHFILAMAKSFKVIETENFIDCCKLGFSKQQYTHDGCPSSPLSVVTMHRNHFAFALYVTIALLAIASQAYSAISKRVAKQGAW